MASLILWKELSAFRFFLLLHLDVYSEPHTHPNPGDSDLVLFDGHLMDGASILGNGH